MVSTPLYLILIVSSIISFNNVYSYHLSLTPMTWRSASDYCTRYCDSQLASIRTIDQHQITQEIISNSDINYVVNNNNAIWIGFNNIQDLDTWTWADGSDTTKFQLWGFSQPDHSSSTTANCVAIDPNTNKWLNTECDEEYAFFCNSCDGEITKLVSPTDTFSTFTEAQHECVSLYETSISMDTISSFDAPEFDATTTSAPSTQFFIESSENEDCRVYDDTEGTLLCDNVMANPGVLCEMPSQICDSKGSQWHNVQGVAMEDYNDVSCGKKINSLNDDSINVIMNKQWKTCNILKPFVVEMTYSTSSPSDASRTGIVIYPPNEVDKDDENGGFNNHYFIRLHPVDGEIHIGYQKEGIEELLQDNRGLDYSWGDNEWETLRVEVRFGYMFTIYLNDDLVLKTRPHNPFDIDMMDVMSGYVGIESIKGDITIKSLYMSGMEVLEDDDTQDYMYNCRFIYDENVDTTTTTPAPTTTSTTTSTDVPTTTTPTTSPTTKVITNKATTTTSTATTSTTTKTTTSTTTTTESLVMNGGAHANVDTNSGLAGGDAATGVNAKQFIVYAIIAAIVCCIIIVGIYYIKLNKKRQREQQLQSVFGRQSRRISRSNDEIADIVAEAHVMQEGRRSSGNSTSFDTMPTSPPRHLTTQSNQSGMIHMHVVDGFDRPSTVWNNNALHNNQRGQGQLQVQQQVQQQVQRPYGGGGHQYYGDDDDDDADILNSWDVEALEMDCNNIIKNNKLKSRNRAYSE